MKPVFLDTVGLLAIWDKTDQWHEAARVVFDQFLVDGVRVTTTEYVLLECGNASARRPYRNAVDRLRIRLDAEKLLIRPTRRDWRSAWENYHKRFANAAGIVDQVSFVVMNRLGLTDAFTNDQHFRAAGLNPLF